MQVTKSTMPDARRKRIIVMLMMMVMVSIITQMMRAAGMLLIHPHGLVPDALCIMQDAWHVMRDS